MRFSFCIHGVAIGLEYTWLLINCNDNEGLPVFGGSLPVELEIMTKQLLKN
jgi:hypothetical protein